MDATRDRWSELDVVARLIGSVVVPIVIFGIGYQFNLDQRSLNDQQLALQRKTEDERDQANLLQQMIGNLGHPEPQHRLIAIEVATYFAAAGQLPPAIKPVLDRIAKEGTAKEAEAATETLNIIPPTVYIHVRSARQGQDAASIETALEERGIVVPVIKRVTNGPSQPELRYFRPEDKANAQKIVTALGESGLNVALNDLSGTYGSRATLLAHRFELWFGPP